MVRNGLYRVIYSGLNGGGYGLAFVADGKIHGGDAMIYYTGTYSIHQNGAVQARLKMKPYVKGESIGMESLFVRDDNTIELEGDVIGDTQAKLEARSKQASGIALQIELQLLEDAL